MPYNSTKKAVKQAKKLSTVPIKAVQHIAREASKAISRTIKKPQPRTSNVQKRSTIGAEVEFFILSKNGRIANEADKILKRIKDKNKGKDIVKECGHNLIEAGCYPDLEGVNTMQSMSDNLETLLYAAEEEDLIICPLGTYPGDNNVRTRQTDHYKVEEKLFGKNTYKQASRCAGMHIHYALPWGVFDFKKLRLKKRINSKHKESLVNSYNFLLAADPGLSVFAQSSPFYQGQFIGKDARALVWRGDSDIKFNPSLYNMFPEFGELPRYKQTGTDLINLTEKMYKNWIQILLDSGIKEKDLPVYKSILETDWTPLRVSRHGTLEARGMDINTPLIALALSGIIQNVLKTIQEEFITVEISDSAINEPFKYEKKKILIPPFTYVKTELQKEAFYKGFEDETIFKYCKRLLWLAKNLGVKKDDIIFEPLEKMIAEKKTVSDDIIALSKKLGHKDFKQTMPADVAAQIALEYSGKLFKEMVLFRELVKRQSK
ncbi:MAG: glutamate-cysteine ligase family protein [Candidatus Kuenenbacteria bacterium]